MKPVYLALLATNLSMGMLAQNVQPVEGTKSTTTLHAGVSYDGVIGYLWVPCAIPSLRGNVTATLRRWMPSPGVPSSAQQFSCEGVETATSEGSFIPDITYSRWLATSWQSNLSSKVDKVSDTADGAIQRRTKLESELPEMVPKAAVVELAKQITALEGRLKALEISRPAPKPR